MARPSILSSLERKFILLLGDLFIIVVSLNVLVNHAIDSEFISNNLKFWVFATGIATYLSLSY
ncbi:MAG: exopolysaccharide biosynthesis protein, partial [Flavobacteriaceae bacterium]